MSTPSSAPRHPVLPVDEQLCFAAYTLTHAFNRRYRLALKEAGLTYPQYLVVLALAQLGKPTVSELAEALRLDYGTLTPMLKRLDAAGVVLRTREDVDERVVRVALSPQGKALRKRVAGVMAEIMAVTGRPPHELAQLVGELSGIRDRLDASSEKLEAAVPGLAESTPETTPEMPRKPPRRPAAG